MLHLLPLEPSQGRLKALAAVTLELEGVALVLAHTSFSRLCLPHGGVQRSRCAQQFSLSVLVQCRAGWKGHVSILGGNHRVSKVRENSAPLEASLGYFSSCFELGNRIKHRTSLKVPVSLLAALQISADWNLLILIFHTLLLSTERK